MSISQAETLIDAMEESIAAALRAPDGIGTPVALLWTDADAQWKPLLLSRTRFPWTQNWLNRSVQGGPEHDR